jgi:outer membrane protein OmpA-like peptidoglycan-associated protein
MRRIILLVFFFALASTSNAASPQDQMTITYSLLEDAKKEGGETYASSVMKEAIFFYEQAERELKNGNNKRAEEFRQISEIRSKTAISISRKRMYENELQRIESEIAETNSIKKSYQDELRKNLLTLEQIKERLAISRDKMLSSALDKLEKASEKIKSAEDVNAQEFNPSVFDEARQTYYMAEESLTLSEYQKSIELSDRAITLAETAYKQSKTKFDLRNGILGKVSRIYGTETEPIKGSLRVSIYGIFAPSGRDILFDAFPSLDAIASVLAEYPNLKVTIKGHTNEEKPEEENTKLADTQAETVKNYFVSKGLSPERFKVISPDLKEGGNHKTQDPHIEVIIELFDSGNT